MKPIVVIALLGQERLNIDGFLNYHGPWISRFEFVYDKSDEYSLDVCSRNPKCNLTSTEHSCFTEENKARDMLQTKVDYSSETALMLDLDERLDLRTLQQVTDRHFNFDVTIGIVKNCDNYFLIDGYPRQVFSNTQLKFHHHTHCWGDINGKSVYYLEYPQINHLIQKPFKRAGADTDEDAERNPDKFLEKKLIALFMNERYAEVVLEYARLKSRLKSPRSQFLPYMVAVLACDKLNKTPEFEELPFFSRIPTKTEAAVHFIRDSLQGRTGAADLSPFTNNPFGITSTYAVMMAKKRGATDGPSHDMWRT